MPGIMTEMIDHYIRTDSLPIFRSHNLSLDLKKFNSNKQDELGRIDMLSFDLQQNTYLNNDQNSRQHMRMKWSA